MGRPMVTGNTATELEWPECGFAQQEVQRLAITNGASFFINSRY